MDQLRSEWNATNSRLVKHVTTLVNKRIEKAYITLPLSRLNEEGSRNDDKDVVVEELIFNKIQNEEFKEYEKVKKVLKDLESCLDKINACGEEKLLVEQNKMKADVGTDGIGLDASKNDCVTKGSIECKYKIGKLREILAGYNQEIKLKCRIVDDLYTQANREILLAYTSAILMEPYLLDDQNTSLY